MYNVDFIRLGANGNFSLTNDKFTKRFRTLSEVAKFMSSSNNLIFAGAVPRLTRQEGHILYTKLRSITDKQRAMEISSSNI